MFVGLYGGTFDPVHLGHIHVAQTVQAVLEMREIRWVLAARPGHRQAPMTSVEHRWNMLNLVCDTIDGFVADDIEILNPGLSYTYDTVVQMRRSSPELCPCWIVGHDSFTTLTSWYQWQALLDECNLIVVERPDQQCSTPDDVEAFERDRSCDRLVPNRVGQIVRLEAAMLPVSATQVRAKVSSGGEFAHLLTPPVYTYINDHQLYAEKAA
jgi:nicotinate-nucleotide adenylyltransferase